MASAAMIAAMSPTSVQNRNDRPALSTGFCGTDTVTTRVR